MVSGYFQTGKSKHYGFIEFESPVVRTLFQISLQQMYAISWLLKTLVMCFGVTGGKDCS
jgi:RNA recognition motif-containing protein